MMAEKLSYQSPRIRSKIRDWLVIISIAILAHIAFIMFFKPQYFRIFERQVIGEEGESTFPALDRPFSLIPFYDQPVKTQVTEQVTPEEVEKTETDRMALDDLGEPVSELLPLDRGGLQGSPGLAGPRRTTVEPKPLFIPWPRYPEGFKGKTGGKVELLLYVNERGEVENVKITRRLPHAELNRIAFGAARKIRFTPGMEKGVPTAMWVRLTIGFQSR